MPVAPDAASVVLELDLPVADRNRAAAAARHGVLAQVGIAQAPFRPARGAPADAAMQLDVLFICRVALGGSRATHSRQAPAPHPPPTPRHIEKCIPQSIGLVNDKPRKHQSMCGSLQPSCRQHPEGDVPLPARAVAGRSRARSSSPRFPSPRPSRSITPPSHPTNRRCRSRSPRLLRPRRLAFTFAAAPIRRRWPSTWCIL